MDLKESDEAPHSMAQSGNEARDKNLFPKNLFPQFWELRMSHKILLEHFRLLPRNVISSNMYNIYNMEKVFVNLSLMPLIMECPIIRILSGECFAP